MKVEIFGEEIRGMETLDVGTDLEIYRKFDIFTRNIIKVTIIIIIKK